MLFMNVPYERFEHDNIKHEILNHTLILASWSQEEILFGKSWRISITRWSPLWTRLVLIY